MSIGIRMLHIGLRAMPKLSFLLVAARARPVSFFWADTDVYQFSLPISDIFQLLKQYLFCLMRQNNHSWSYFAFSQIFSNYGRKTLQCNIFLQAI